MSRSVIALFKVVLPVLLLALSLFYATPTHAQGQAGTTLSAEKTATGFWDVTVEYDWSITKMVTPTVATIARGDSADFEYWIDVTRSETSRVESRGVRGQICVTNGGERSTENLKLVDQVEWKMGGMPFEPLPGASQTITPTAQLGPGESACYDYEIQFTPEAGKLYRNTVKVTITNHSGHLGEEFGPEPKADFAPPGAPTLIETDESAMVADVLTCPAGFTCTPDSAGPWAFDGSGSAHYTIQVTNVSAPCDETFFLDNTATLTENDSGQQRSASAQARIFTGECPGACTRTIGYWKTHAGFHGHNADRVTPLLPVRLGTNGGTKTVQVTSAAQAVALLEFSGDASNGINKLYAQLLGAKLNIASGADGSNVAATIASADAFLANNNAANWTGLSRTQKNNVLAWMTALDNYNNGLNGPGHCN